MNNIDLTDEQFHKLLSLCNLYHREAKKSMNAKAYHAGCVMIGATLETILITICYCYSDEIPESLIPKLKGKSKHLLKWSLFDLLNVARELNWLPSGLNLKDKWDHKIAKIGDYAVVLKEFRNLVHPSVYITTFSKTRIAKQRMERCFEILARVPQL